MEAPSNRRHRERIADEPTGSLSGGDRTNIRGVEEKRASFVYGIARGQQK